MPKITDRPQRILRNPGRIGYPPSAQKTGLPASDTANSLRLLSHNRQIFACNCYPSDLVNRSDATNTNFYVVSRFQQQPSGTQAYMTGVAVLSPYDHRSDNGTVTWYPNYTSSSSGTGYILYTEPPVDAWTTMTPRMQIDAVNRTIVFGGEYFYHTEIDGTPEFRMGLLKFNHMLPAALGVFHRGPVFNSPPPTNLVPPPSDCSEGAAIRGYNSFLYRQGLGDLIYRTCDVDTNADRVTSAISSPVWSWGIPGGIWCGANGTDGSTRNVFGTGATVKVRAFTPFDETAISVRPVIVYSTGTAGSYTCSFEAVSNALGTFTATLTKSSNPEMDDFSGASGYLTLTAGAEAQFYVKITLDDADGDNWIIIHSISLWPIY